MDQHPMKQDLHDALGRARAALVWKTEGVSEYDRRRPLTATGTNLLGLLKHLTLVEQLHLGWSFGRPAENPPSWCVYGTEESDFWALPHQSHGYLVEQYRAACAHADATIEALDLDAEGTMPWGEPVTLHRALVHVLGEAQRHLGHADIVRENVDGSVGVGAESDGVRTHVASWHEQHAQVEEAARAAVSP